MPTSTLQSNTLTLPKPLAITPGEPAGIGFDVVLSAIAQQKISTPIVIIADKYALFERAKLLGINVDLADYDSSTPSLTSVLHVPLSHSVHPGQPDWRNAADILKTLDIASQMCHEGYCSALVTGAIHKACINQADIPFSGHTEYLAQLTHSDTPVMLMASPILKVALLTTHLPLQHVSQQLRPKKLRDVLVTLHEGLTDYFKIEHPRIQVCGLNPHAGEQGYLGTEEIDVMIPTIQRLRTQGLDISWPVPADTAFVPQRHSRYDVTLSMYHDQGLPVIKALSFGQIVNVTLGLPFIRCSVDHGTALDIAGTGQADSDSFLQALTLASTLAAATIHTDHT